MLENLTQSFKAHMYERTTSPLFWAFITSWSLWNYKTILTLFADMSVQEKIHYIENTIYADQYAIGLELVNGANHFAHVFAFPLISAILFILIYPYPSRWIYSFWKARQIELNNEKLKQEKKALVQQETHQRLKQDYFELKASFDNLVRDKDEEIENLQKSLQAMQEELDKLKPQPQPQPRPQPIHVMGEQKVKNKAVQTKDEKASVDKVALSEEDEMVVRALAVLGSSTTKQHLLETL